MRAAGLRGLCPDNIIDLKLAEVLPAYVKSLNALVSEPLSSDQIIQLRVLGVDAAFANNIRKRGLANLTFQQILSLRIFPRGLP